MVTQGETQDPAPSTSLGISAAGSDAGSTPQLRLLSASPLSAQDYGAENADASETAGEFAGKRLLLKLQSSDRGPKTKDRHSTSA